MNNKINNYGSKGISKGSDKELKKVFNNGKPLVDWKEYFKDKRKQDILQEAR